METYDIIQLLLALIACAACYFAGMVKGANNILDYLEDEGVIKIDRE